MGQVILCGFFFAFGSGLWGSTFCSGTGVVGRKALWLQRPKKPRFCVPQFSALPLASLGLPVFTLSRSPLLNRSPVTDAVWSPRLSESREEGILVLFWVATWSLLFLRLSGCRFSLGTGLSCRLPVRESATVWTQSPSLTQAENWGYKWLPLGSRQKVSVAFRIFILCKL